MSLRSKHDIIQGMDHSLDSTQPTSHSTQTDPLAPARKSTTTAALDGRGVARAALIVMFFFVLSRATGLAREIIIGAQFGTSSALDAYLAAFRVPDLLFQLVAGGALGSAFIPTFAAAWNQAQPTAAWLLFSRVLNLVTLVLIGMAGLAALFALPLVQGVIAPGFSLEQQLLTANLMRWMLLSTIVFGASGLMMGALNAAQYFVLPAAAPVFYNLAIIAGAWLLAPRFGIYGLVMGVVAGALAHLFVQLPGLWQLRARYTPTFAVADPGVREVMRLMGPRVLGLFFVQMHFLINTILASGLAAGSLSALNYAWLLMLLPQGIFAQSIATAIFPTFAAQVATGQRQAMQRAFGQTLRMVLFLTIPAAVGLYVLRAPLVEALLQRRAFGADSTQMVAYALQFYALGLVAHAVVEIAVRAFYAMHNTLTPVAVGVAAMLLNIGLSLWWIGRWGYGGLALANSVATGIEMCVLLWFLRKQMGGLDGLTLLGSVARNGVAAALMGLILAAWLWSHQQPFFPRLPGLSGAWIATLGGLGIAALGYALAGILLRSPELRPALAILWRRR